ncbi:MAG: glycine--tRNA ligase subunit beta [Candidatus Latescibacteria bacterium]|nr:glycine--tRNA ligase subunit beta [Candidatus Latescibacterota bacterium]
MADLLVELFSEEIPARMQGPMANNLKGAVATQLEKNQLEYQVLETYVTPRRLVVRVDGLPVVQEDTVQERRGPRTSAPEQAVEGFLRGNGLTMEQVEKRVQGKDEFYFATITTKGKAVDQVLPGLLEEVIGALSWPKSMRWGSNPIRWVRPLKNILAVFNGAVLPVSFGHLHSNDQAQGHRFLGPEAFAVSDFACYEKELAQRHVVLDSKERQQRIAEQAAELAQGAGLELLADQGLLGEVAGLVEWPVVLLGQIDAQFMEVPEEVLISSIRKHQKYFCLRQANGTLAPHFLVVSNMVSDDGGAGIVAGNERVLRARLADAVFFWDQDGKRPLAERVVELDRMVFHARLGSVGAKTARLQQLAGRLAEGIPGAEAEACQRAALLCKADLVTEMVGEFPDLQGTMGAYYARQGGETEEVALALKEHYAPLGPNDTCPRGPVSVAVALADKIDTLVGLFAASEKPTGAKDPFALRRAALGVIRLLLENELSVPLRPVFAFALEQFPVEILAAPPAKKKGGKEAQPQSPEQVVDDLLAFFGDRLKVSLRERQVRHDLISAVFDGGDQDDLLRVLQRVETLATFLDEEAGDNLLVAYRRAANILRIEEKKDKIQYNGAPAEELLEAAEEKALYAGLRQLQEQLPPLLQAYRYDEAVAQLAQLRGPVDAFFEQVTVNCDEPELRRNRLFLLADLRVQMDQIAHFALIEKEG